MSHPSLKHIGIVVASICILSWAFPSIPRAQAQSAQGQFRLTFPLQGLRHDTAQINTVFDHALRLRARRAYASDGVITAFTGESASTNVISTNGCYSGPDEFIVNGAYRSATGNKTDLCYDGHPGYDFYARSLRVVAAANGKVEYAFDGCADNTHPGTGCDVRNGNHIVIDHQNGYKTYYLHLSQSSFSAVALQGKDVTAGQIIAVTDNTGTSSGEHLHFEVQRKVENKYYPVDPYGWNGPGQDPYTLHNTGIENVFLWDQTPDNYTLTDLGTLGGSSSYANDVNESGTVVGFSDLPGDASHQAFRWTAADGMVGLPTLGGTYSSAVALNDAGVIVGLSSRMGASPVHGVVWTDPGTVLDLGRDVFPVAINKDGVVVGYVISGSARQAFRWTEAGGLDILGIPEGMTRVFPQAVNDSGTIVGSGVLPSGVVQAVVWQPGIGWLVPLSLGGNHAELSAISKNGLAVGVAYGPEGTQRAVVWESGGGLQDIGPGVARAVSDSGIVVGAGVGSTSTYGFSWTAEGGWVPIPTLGGNSADAKEVNSIGLVVGGSVLTGENQYHGFVWSGGVTSLDLGTIGGTPSEAVGVSENNLVIGWSRVAGNGGPYHAVAWVPVE